ncbi:MAG: O-methyltransferase, family 3 [Caulobacteraceae bacterium]|nr:O-methyltransferase, family 3 [Caulobacteraceae bacterium]
MSSEAIGLSAALTAYLRSVGAPEDADLIALREETAGIPRGGMQISPEQGALMRLLIKLLGARNCLEVGVFTGYSTMVVAKAMGPGGRVVALDVSEEWTAIARRHWQAAGVADRIDLRLAPAAQSLEAMVAAGEAGRYDFAFIDADKPGYDTYYEHALTLLRPGGVIGIDNVLWSGAVADPKDQSEDTVALRALNAKIRNDRRVEANMIPIGDGLTLARKL